MRWTSIVVLFVVSALLGTWVSALREDLLHVIINHCADESCYQGNSRDLDSRVLFDYMSTGPNVLVWRNVIKKFDTNQALNVSQSCERALRNVVTALFDRKRWAFLMLDASAKIPPAYLESTVAALGDYDECLGVRSVDIEEEINGAYCMVDMFATGTRTAFEDKYLNLANLHSNLFINIVS